MINISYVSANNFSCSGSLYEIAISITEENDSVSPLYYVNSYYYKFLTIKINETLDFSKKSNSFLSIESPISVVNMWRRKTGSFIRLFNPNDRERITELRGELVDNQVRELDLNYNELALLESDNINVNPWEIKTLKL